MIILVMLVILWTPYVVTRLMLRVHHARTPAPAHKQQACAEPRSGQQTGSDSQDTPAWSELDDRRLTRLLTDSAPRTITE